MCTLVRLARKAFELLAHREGGVEGRYVHRVSERPVDYVGAAGLPFVEDDGCLRSSRLGILDLHHEVAGASLDERYVALRLGREVGGLTAAVRGALLDARRNDDVISGHDLPPYVPRSGVLHKSVVRVVHVGAGGWSEALEGWGTGLLKERELEGLFGDDGYSGTLSCRSGRGRSHSPDRRAPTAPPHWPPAGQPLSC